MYLLLISSLLSKAIKKKSYHITEIVATKKSYHSTDLVDTKTFKTTNFYFLYLKFCPTVQSEDLRYSLRCNFW